MNRTIFTVKGLISFRCGKSYIGKSIKQTKSNFKEKQIRYSERKDGGNELRLISFIDILLHHP